MRKKLFLLLFISAFAFSISANNEPKQPESYNFQRGVELYQAEKYDDAKTWFEKEISASPENGYAYYYLSVIYNDDGEQGAALTAIDRSIKYLPKKDKTWRSFSYVQRAEVYLNIGDTVQAYSDLAQAIKIDPSISIGYEHRAQLYYEQSNYALSDADYRKMIELDKGDVMGYMGLGRNAKEQEQYDNALSQFNLVVKLAPDYSSGYSFRAEVYILQDEWVLAADDVIKALSIDVDRKAFYILQYDVPKEKVEIFKSKFKIQMTKEPNNYLWPYCIAVLCENYKDYNGAIEYYEKSNSLNADPITLSNLSQCYYEKGDYEQALNYADRSLDMDDEKLGVIKIKADILSSMGRYDECLKERDKCISIAPESPQGYFYRAFDYLKVRKYKEVVEDINTVMLLSPELQEFTSLLITRGDAYRLLGKTEEANKDYEKVIALESEMMYAASDSVYVNGVEVQDTLCAAELTAESYTPFAYSGLGNAEKAIETMTYILENDTTDVTGALYNAACVYARLGRKDDAIEYLKEAIAKGYSNYQHIKVDYDLDILRDMPEFEKLLENEGKLQCTDTEIVDDSTIDDTTRYVEERVEVPFSKEGGVTKVKCTINGLPLHFVFDTGAADVTMSMVEANFMLKNDYIKRSDVIGSSFYSDANGDITEGTVLNLRHVNFGGLELENVRASVVRNQKAPLLLGQSVLGRLGRIEIDNAASKLVITHKVVK